MDRLNKNKIRLLLTTILGLVIVALLLSSCSSTKITSDSSEDKVVYLGEIWSHTDSRFVAEQFTNDLVSRSWLKDFVTNNNDQPTLFIVVENLTNENVSIPIFVNNLHNMLADTGLVNLLKVSPDGVGYSQSSVEKAESEADFKLQGSITISDIEEQDEPHKAYYIELKLIDISTGKEVWIGSKEVRKVGVTPPL